MKSKSLFVFVFAACCILFTQCSDQDDVIRLNAPEAASALWKDWNGRYRIYVHKEAKVKEFKDLDNMVLMIAFINANDIIGDAQAFSQKCDLKWRLTLQNNPKMYDNQFLESSGSIAIMVPEVATHYKFDVNDKLIEVQFE